LVAEHLIGLGHWHIGFIGNRPERGLGFVPTRRRLPGYRRALASAGVQDDPPPAAIFAASDATALGAPAAAEHPGLSIRADLPAGGDGAIDAAARLRLPTVSQPLPGSSAGGASRLCAAIRGKPVRPLRAEPPVAVVAWASSAWLARPPSRPPPDRATRAAALAGGGACGRGQRERRESKLHGTSTTKRS
jgi:LacI family transcriptional regulator